MLVQHQPFEFIGAQLYIPHLLEIVARRPVYVRLALWFLHHPAWVKGHTGGSRLTPIVHPCPTRNPHMVAEQEFRTTTQKPASQLRRQPLRPLAQVMVAAEQIPSQSAAQQLSRSPPERTSSDDDESSTPSMEQSEEAAPATPVSKVLKRCWRMPRWSHPR